MTSGYINSGGNAQSPGNWEAILPRFTRPWAASNLLSWLFIGLLSAVVSQDCEHSSFFFTFSALISGTGGKLLLKNKDLGSAPSRKNKSLASAKLRERFLTGSLSSALSDSMKLAALLRSILWAFINGWFTPDINRSEPNLPSTSWLLLLEGVTEISPLSLRMSESVSNSLPPWLESGDGCPESDDVVGEARGLTAAERVSDIEKGRFIGMECSMPVRGRDDLLKYWN